METQARYALIGLFTLAVIAAGFGFVYWLHHTGGLGERAIYRVRFETAVSGLRPGSAVLFNGIRVGEVSDLRLSPGNPREVTATIAVERSTPVRRDTQVGIDVQGLMGSPTIALRGGTADAATLSAAPGEIPALVADAAASQDTMQTAREVLRHIDQVVVENAEPLRGTIQNLQTFTGALARNSNRLEGIIEGVERMTGGGAPKPGPTIYDLAAPSSFPGISQLPAGQLVVADPTTVVAMETQKILIRTKEGETSSFPNAQWSDSLPKLFQARIIQGFENAKYPRVGRPGEAFASDHQLLIDIRSFRISLEQEPVAEIEFGAKIVGEGGRVAHARIFKATVPTAAADAAEAAIALNRAFGTAVSDLVGWTLPLI